MSYRSFKRVLGETSLERKCRFLFGATLLVLIAGSFYLYGRQTEEIVDKQNPIRGRLLVDTILANVHWEKFEQNEEFKRVIRDLSATWQVNKNKYDWSSIRPNYVETGRQSVDDFERAFLRRAENGPPTVPPGTVTDDGSQETLIVEDGRPVDGGRQFEYYQAVYAAHSCVGCHSTFPEPRSLSNGQLMSVVKVRISNASQADINQNRAFLLAYAIVTVFLAMVASWIIVRYVIAKPLKHLREVSDEVSKGNLAQRADIQTGDEFEALATAFNRMLRHLGETQHELRETNGTLDAKVDELAQVNMRLFELNRLKSDFLATMSHELRTPLNSIIGFIDVLGSIASLDDKQKRYVQNIKKSGKVLLDMINDILDLAKIESGKMELRVKPFAVEQVITAQCDAIRPLSEKKNIDVTVDVEPTDEPLHQDAAKIQQILNNLLSNAVKFTPEGGRIRVSARQNEDEELEMVVADTGVGISEEDQEAIFEKFRQGAAAAGGGRDAMTREYTGTGLGLSIVRELCKLLGGDVSLKSELGKGSEFTVRLPWRFRDLRPGTMSGDSLDGLAISSPNSRGRDADGEPTTAPSPSLGIGDP